LRGTSYPENEAVQRILKGLNPDHSTLWTGF
jgi:hypothetical protein